MGFPMQGIIINLLYNTLSSGTNLGPFSACHLKRSCTLLGDAIIDR